ncbi:heparan-alpha-glucosaminide N-acetyltransferase [Anaerococcus lactolyticus]|uniref:Membrane protein n=1 Tax=Anaerococcus lactolyticus S7-1-13 TaxID=1284686 RepID=A0A095X3B4_9FIRM|nr:heparan-alpha-glucosaminide N-acetyltransferase [Anaerococcus lactolyticus]KGF04196.1 membrane protein [Anaerococcus lactolyticus S7-1-13]
MKRIQIIDTVRGLTIISMVLFHLFYNINYFRTLDFYNGTVFNRIWQLSIALSFFLISGITSSFFNPRKNFKRGLSTSLIGFAITIITFLFAKDQLIIWGVLNGLGLSMIIAGLIQNLINPKLWPVFLLAFAFSYKIPAGLLWDNSFFNGLYQMNLFPIGFPSFDFYSNDYFPLIPWLFAFLAGLSLGKYLHKKNFFNFDVKENFLAKIGRHSMLIYITHQIILYPLVSLIYKLTL